MKKILINFLLLFLICFIGPKKIWASTFQCGETFTLPMFNTSDCNCANYDLMNTIPNPPPGITTYIYCCGWYYDDACNASLSTNPTAIPSPQILIPPVDEDLLNELNPLKNYSTKADQLSTPGGIISEVLTYAFPIAGVILFVMLIMAGFKMLTGASNSSNMEEGKKMISTAIVGFIILFAAYWIAQLIEIIFGISILGVQQLN